MDTATEWLVWTSFANNKQCKQIKNIALNNTATILMRDTQQKLRITNFNNPHKKCGTKWLSIEHHRNDKKSQAKSKESQRICENETKPQNGIHCTTFVDKFILWSCLMLFSCSQIIWCVWRLKQKIEMKKDRHQVGHIVERGTVEKGNAIDQKVFCECFQFWLKWFVQRNYTTKMKLNQRKQSRNIRKKWIKWIALRHFIQAFRHHIRVSVQHHHLQQNYQSRPFRTWHATIYRTQHCYRWRCKTNNYISIYHIVFWCVCSVHVRCSI